jgi:hypothetical protein
MEGYKYFVGAEDSDDDVEDGCNTPVDHMAEAEALLEDEPEAGPALSAKELPGEDAGDIDGDAIEAAVGAEISTEELDGKTFLEIFPEEAIAGATADAAKADAKPLSEKEAATLKSLREALAAVRADMPNMDKTSEEFLMRRIKDLETKKRVRSDPGSLTASARHKYVSNVLMG